MRWMLIAAASWCVLGFGTEPTANGQSSQLDTYFSGTTVVYVEFTGARQSQAALEQTAAYAAFDESGLRPAIYRLVDSLPWDQLISEADFDADFVSLEQLIAAYHFVNDNGMAMGVSLPPGPPLSTPPYGLIVIRNGAQHSQAVTDWAQQVVTFALESQSDESEEAAPPGIPKPVFKLDDVGYQPPVQLEPLRPSSSQKKDEPEVRPAAAPNAKPPAPVVKPVTTAPARSDEEPVEKDDEPEDETEDFIPLELQRQRIGNRDVVRVRGYGEPGQQLVEWAWWTEGPHLVVYVGHQDVEQHLASIDADGQSLAEHPLWQSAQQPESEGETQTGYCWMNCQLLVDRFGDLPVPGLTPAMSAGQLLEPLGLTDLQYVDYRSGYAGRLQKSAFSVQFNPDAEPVGLSAIVNQPRLTLDDIPPLPRDVHWFNVHSFDIRASIRMFDETGSRLARLFGDEALLQWQMARGLIAAQDLSTFDKVLDCLGPSICVYNDSEQEVLGWGPSAIVLAVDDEARLQTLLDDWEKSTNANPAAEYAIETRQVAGFKVYGLTHSQGIATPTLALCGRWLVAGIQPQTVQAFAYRVQGKLPVWTTDQLEPETLEAIPDRFTGLSYSDPRPAVRFLVSLVPWGVDAIRFGVKQAPGEFGDWKPNVSALDIPPAELVNASLFPNVSVSTYERGRYRSEASNSTSASNLAVWFVGGYVALSIVGVAAM